MTITQKLEEWGPMTVLMIVVAVIAMVVGGLVVLIDPASLTFAQYLDNLKAFAIAIAGVAGARGILGAGKHVAEARVHAAALSTPSQPPEMPSLGQPAGPVGEAAPIGDEALPTDEEEFAALAGMPDEEWVEDDYHDDSGELALAGAVNGAVKPDRPADGG